MVLSSALKFHDLGQHEQHADYEHVEYAPAHESGGDHGETELHHHVDHKHATSHQSVKLHHFHPVPVYIKKEDMHLLKKPVEIGGTKQKVKVLHPETEKNHNYGLVLEEYVESKLHHYGGDHGGHYEEPSHYEGYGHE